MLFQITCEKLLIVCISSIKKRCNLSPEKVKCPFCGEEIDADALQCPKCGNRWDDAEEREAIRVMLSMPGVGEKRARKLYEAGFRKIKDIEEADLEEILKKAGIPLRVAKEVKERVEEKQGIYICPNCGAFVSADAKTCPICGASLEGIEEISEIGGEEERSALKDDLFIDEAENLYVCKVCGAFVSESMDACPVCGAKMPENRAEMPEKVEDKYLEDEEKNVEALKRFFKVETLPESGLPTEDVLETSTEIDMCPNCGAFVRPEAETCPVCGASLLPDISEEEEKKEAEEAIMALEDLKEELVGADILDITHEEEENEKAVFICPECGAEVPEDADRCPNCGAIFAGEEEIEGEKEEEGVVLSIEDVMDTGEMGEVGMESSENESAQEEIKAQVDSLIVPSSKEKEKKEDFEDIELSLGLEGGLDAIASIDVRERKEKKVRLPALDVPKRVKKKEWYRLEDYIMAASSIALVLLVTEYLLTYPYVRNPKIAYGSSALSIFVSILFLSSLVLFLDRKKVFSRKIPAMFMLLPIFILLLVPMHWYMGIRFDRPLLSDIVLVGLASLLFGALFFIFRHDVHYFFIFYLGLFVVAVHSILFMGDFYDILPNYDPVPAYAMAIYGGSVLSLGVYMRIDSAVRMILSTRDVLLGHKYYMSGEYDKAMKYYSRAISRKKGMESGYDLAYYSKGTALLNAGNTVEALKYLNRAIKDNPNNEMAWNNRGIALSNLGLDDAALKSYERALMINPKYEVAWNNKGNVLARMGRYDEALKCYERALNINPNYRDAWMNKGYVLIKLDRYREAKECAEHILPGKRKGIRRAVA